MIQVLIVSHMPAVAGQVQVLPYDDVLPVTCCSKPLTTVMAVVVSGCGLYRLAGQAWKG